MKFESFNVSFPLIMIFRVFLILPFFVFISLSSGEVKKTPVIEVIEEVIEKVEFSKNSSFELQAVHFIFQPVYQNLYAEHRLGLFYNLEKLKNPFAVYQKKLQVNLGYKHSFFRAVPEPNNYGFKDVVIQLNYPFVWVNSFIGCALPLSSVSRRASLLGSFQAGVNKLWKKDNVSLGMEGSIQGFWHQYKSVGIFPNPWVSSRFGINLRMQTKWMDIVPSAVFYTFYDYNRDIHSYQAMVLELSHSFKKMGVFLAFSWNSNPRSIYINLDQFYTHSAGVRMGLSWKV